MDLSKIKGIIFDLDEVLANTERWHWQAWVETLKPFGINFSKEDYFNYAGKREDIIGRELTDYYKINLFEGELARRKKALMHEWVRTRKIEFLPYAKEAVEFFYKIAQSGRIKMAICAGSTRTDTLLKLEKLGLFPYFPVVCTGDEVKNGKPAPDIYLLSCEKLGLKPEECLAFEDSEYGARSAKDAGMACFAIPSEFSVKQDFSMVDKIFHDLGGVIEFCKRIILIVGFCSPTIFWRVFNRIMLIKS